MKQSKKFGLRSAILMMFLLACLGAASPAAATPSHKFLATVGANAFRSASADYRQVYGQAVVMPEFKLTFLVAKNVSLWGGFAWVAKKGMVEEVDETAKISQSFLSFGAGYARKLSAKLRLRGELGVTRISFKEDALGVVNKGSGLGWKLGAGLDYLLGKRWFVTITGAYSQASDKTGAGEIELGGWQLGAGAGLSF